MSPVINWRQHRLVVKPHRPGRQLLLLLIACLVAATGAWVAFRYGQWQEIYDHMTLRRSRNEDARAVLDRLTTENSDLKQRVTILERAAQIDKEADQRLHQHIRQLQDEAYELREEVEFYRKVVGAAKDGNELRVQAMRVEPMGEEGRFQYKLVLTNLSKDDKVTRGHAEIEVSGKSGGQPQKFRVTTTKDGSRTAALGFSFVHFHRLEGDFTLPSGFLPESVRVVVLEGGAKEPMLDTSYKWQSLVQAKG